MIHDLQLQIEAKDEEMQADDYNYDEDDYNWEDFTSKEQEDKKPQEVPDGLDIHFRCEGYRCRFCGSDAKEDRTWINTEYLCEACYNSDCTGFACSCVKKKQEGTGQPDAAVKTEKTQSTGRPAVLTPEVPTPKVDEDKPKVKEADEIGFPDYPTQRKLRGWK